MPKFLTGCHYNVIEISQHLEKYIGYWPVQVNGNKLATGQILEKTGRSCEWADFSWWSSKVSRTLSRKRQRPSASVSVRLLGVPNNSDPDTDADASARGWRCSPTQLS